jgi:hypothetical protein
MIVTLDSKRRLTVPASLAPTSPGEYFDAQFDAEEDAIVFRRLAGKEDWLARRTLRSRLGARPAARFKRPPLRLRFASLWPKARRRKRVRAKADAAWLRP